MEWLVVTTQVHKLNQQKCMESGPTGAKEGKQTYAKQDERSWEMSASRIQG